jgi:diadenosine tetraphosphate (Ap4A) HIT family hydrolase
LTDFIDMAGQMVFQLDERLAADTLPVLSLGLCAVRLMSDSRWPWLILVPQRADIRELYQLTPLDQAMLTFETALLSEAFAKITNSYKLNIGALGNVVPQFHLHVVARNIDDPNWPRPVWGFGEKVPYNADIATAFIDRLRAAF